MCLFTGTNTTFEYSLYEQSCSIERVNDYSSDREEEDEFRRTQRIIDKGGDGETENVTTLTVLWLNTKCYARNISTGFHYLEIQKQSNILYTKHSYFLSIFYF